MQFALDCKKVTAPGATVQEGKAKSVGCTALFNFARFAAGFYSVRADLVEVASCSVLKVIFANMHRLFS